MKVLRLQTSMGQAGIWMMQGAQAGIKKMRFN